MGSSYECSTNGFHHRPCHLHPHHLPPPSGASETPEASLRSLIGIENKTVTLLQTQGFLVGQGPPPRSLLLLLILIITTQRLFPSRRGHWWSETITTTTSQLPTVARLHLNLSSNFKHPEIPQTPSNSPRPRESKSLQETAKKKQKHPTNHKLLSYVATLSCSGASLKRSQSACKQNDSLEKAIQEIPERPWENKTPYPKPLRK